jgi:hypothetical protein
MTINCLAIWYVLVSLAWWCHPAVQHRMGQIGMLLLIAPVLLARRTCRACVDGATCLSCHLGWRDRPRAIGFKTYFTHGNTVALATPALSHVPLKFQITTIMFTWVTRKVIIMIITYIYISQAFLDNHFASWLQTIKNGQARSSSLTQGHDRPSTILHTITSSNQPFFLQRKVLHLQYILVLPNAKPWAYAKYVRLKLPLHKRSSAIEQVLLNANPPGTYKICTAPNATS